MTHRAITSPDILYLIFLHLPQHDLLLIQRVCRPWRPIISRSTALQQALFLHPGADDHLPNPQNVQLNPLLRARFPAFLQHRACSGSEAPYEHGLGPWSTTHWAENIKQAWPTMQLSGGGCKEPPMPLPPVATIELDPPRSAAYKRPEASWRRMLPRLPPPQELQVFMDDKLRTMQFADEFRMTFGCFYQIVETAWFDDAAAYLIQFDWTFEDVVREYTGRSTRHNREYAMRERLRKTYAPRNIGGERRLLVMLRYAEIRPRGEKRYRGSFKFHGSMERGEWEEEL